MSYDLYTSTLLLGAAGLVVMALGGIGRHAGGARHSGVGHQAGHNLGGARHGGANHAGHAGHGHAGHNHAAHAHAGPSAPHLGFRQAAARTLWTFASPRVLFSLFLGFGTSGSLFRPVLPEPLLLVTALFGAVVFERAIVGPLWSATLRFASEPAATLESSVTDVATAVTSFDANGQGIVALEVDGQVVQVLGTLQSVDRELGVSVRAGQRVRIESVDAERNRCTVSRE